MGAVKNLMVRAGADFSAITNQASKASNSMRGMQSSVSRSCNAMTKAAAGLKRAFGAIGIGLSIGAIVNAAKEAAAAYDEQVAGEMRLATVMRNTMGASNDEIQSILDLTAAQQQLGIVGDEVQLAGAQELATYLSLTDSLQTLIPVMNDMAVQQYGFNVTAEETASIATMLGKVMEGQVSGLSRYGYYFDEAQEAVLKYGTEAERAAMLAEVVSQSVGGMNAALAATPTGRMQQLSNAIGDIKESFGAAVRTVGTVFLPVLNTVGAVLAGIATMANKVAQAIANVFGGSVAGKEWSFLPASTAGNIEAATDATDDLTEAQKSAGGAAKQAAKELQTAGFDTLNILKKQAEASGGGGGGTAGGGGGGGADLIRETSTAAEEASSGISWIEQKLQSLKAVWEEFRSRLDFSGLQRAWENLKGALSNFGSAVGSILGPIWTNILEPLAVWTINEGAPSAINNLAAAFQLVADVIKSEKVQELIEGVTKAIGDLVMYVAEDVQGMVDDLTFVFQLLDTLVNEGPVAAFQLIKDHAGIESKETKQKWADFPQWFADHAALPVAEAVEAWEEAHPGIAGAVNGIRDAISDFFGGLPSLFEDDGEKPLEDWESSWEESQPILSRIMDGITGDVSSMHDSVGRDFDGMERDISGDISSIRGLMNFSWSLPRPRLPHISWSWSDVGGLLSIPHFSIDWYAQGGIFDQASIIGVGEAGKEAVVPLERNAEWISSVADGLASRMTGSAGLFGGDLGAVIRQAVSEALRDSGTGSGSHTAVLTVDGREFARAIYDDNVAVAREHGVNFASA